MSGGKKRRPAPSATPWDGLPEDEIGPAQRAVMEGQRSIYAFRHERCAGDIEFFNAYERGECPSCGAPPVRDGFAASGLRRYRCPACGRRFTPVTGTIFDNSKLPLAAWADFIIQALSFESVSAMTREDRRARTTAPWWMAKLFAVAEGIQDGHVLGGRAWVDETYWPVAAADLERRADGSLPPGLSRNLLCIAVGVDADGLTVARPAGRGKPSKARIWDAMGGHIAPGSTLVHDMEKSHSVLVERLGLASERHNAAALRGVPDRDNPLDPVNDACDLVKRFLGAHPGFRREDLPGYLDLFSIAMNEPADKMEKAAMLLDRAMLCPKTLRFREFYNVSPRSGEGEA